MNKFSRVKVFFAPDWSKENPYQNLLASKIRAEGYDVDLVDYPGNLFPLSSLAKASGGGVIHVHWLRPIIDRILWSRNPVKRYVKLFIFSLDVVAARVLGAKVVWTVHNLVSHESVDFYFEKLIRGTLFWLANSVIFHSLENMREFSNVVSGLNRKFDIIPHGNYEGVYPAVQLTRRPDFETKDVVILFLGQIRSYKGIVKFSELFDEFNIPGLRLKILGKESDKLSGDLIRGICRKSTSIEYIPGFVPDEEVSGHYQHSDAVVVPFERALTSGSVILAMTLGRVVILPEHAKVLGLPDEANIFYYNDGNLKEVLLGLPSKSILQQMGLVNREISRGWSWDMVAKMTVDVYCSRGSRGEKRSTGR